MVLGPAASSAFGLNWPPLCCGARCSLGPSQKAQLFARSGPAGHPYTALGHLTPSQLAKRKGKKERAAFLILSFRSLKPQKAEKGSKHLVLNP